MNLRTIKSCILIFGCLIIGVNSSYSQNDIPQEKSDGTPVYYRIQTDRGYAEGRIIRETETEIEVLKTNNEIIYIAKNQIISKTIIPNPSKIGPIVHPTRYLYAPSAIPLKQGEGYLNLIYFLAVQAQYGITDNISIGMTTTPILMPTFINLKVGGKIGEDLYASVGGQMGKLFYADEDNLGLMFANVTYGNKEANVTLNTGYGFYSQSKENLPIIEISGLYQSSPKVTLVGEFWVLLHENRAPTMIGGPALRINAFRKGFLDVGVLSAAFTVEEDNGYYDVTTSQWVSNIEKIRKSYWPIPFVSAGLTF